jgi:hypothetical protein
VSWRMHIYQKIKQGCLLVHRRVQESSSRMTRWLSVYPNLINLAWCLSFDHVVAWSRPDVVGHGDLGPVRGTVVLLGHVCPRLVILNSPTTAF